jgi:hypothetical protein
MFNSQNREIEREIERDRERERETNTEREREREREILYPGALKKTKRDLNFVDLPLHFQFCFLRCLLSAMASTWRF